jgi:hypothetical protein
MSSRGTDRVVGSRDPRSVYPDAASGLGVVWALAAIAWGVVFVAAAETHPGRGGPDAVRSPGRGTKSEQVEDMEHEGVVSIDGVVDRSLRPCLAGRLRSYAALTKPRIIELLLVTTVPAMIVAERGVPSLRLVLATLSEGRSPPSDY